MAADHDYFNPNVDKEKKIPKFPWAGGKLSRISYIFHSVL